MLLKFSQRVGTPSTTEFRLLSLVRTEVLSWGEPQDVPGPVNYLQPIINKTMKKPIITIADHIKSSMSMTKDKNQDLHKPC